MTVNRIQKKYFKVIYICCLFYYLITYYTSSRRGKNYIYIWEYWIAFDDFDDKSSIFKDFEYEE